MFTSALKSLSSNISANYTISSTPTSLSGAWKIYDGKKKSTGKAVSVFIFDRKLLEPHSGALGGRSGGSSVKKVYEEVTSRVKKESNLLARLRHPSILELEEPIEETRSGGLMFVTEPVTASLAGLLQEKDDEERGGAAGWSSRYVMEEAHGQKQRRTLEIDELEIQKGLLQVAQGLEFLHESAQLVHGNLTPEAVFVNVKSDWKIAGLAFAGPPDTSNTQSTTSSLSLSEALYHDPRLPPSLQLNLDYTSPDFVLDNNVSAAADMFSLGLLILALYNSPHISPLKVNSNISTYKKIVSSSSEFPSLQNNFLSSKSLPREVVSDVLPRLITRRPGQRMNAREFQQSQLFDNILVSSIRFLDTFPAKSPNEKSQFMRGLPRILPQFPKSVLEKKVLPSLLEEMKDKELLSLVLQNVFKIIKILPSASRVFTDKVIPRLRETFSGGGGKNGSQERDSAKEAGLIVVLENMELIGENSNGKEFKDDILPILHNGLDSTTHSIVDKSLSCLPTILSILDFSTIKNELFPVVAAVFSKTNSLGIKIRGLEAFVILCGGSGPSQTGNMGDGLDGTMTGSKNSKPPSSTILDKYTVQEKVVPLLKAIKTKEPAVMMAALAVFRQVGKLADADFLAMDVLPLLWSFSLGPLLNLEQFQEYMKLIRFLSSKIEQEQTRKLQHLASNMNGSLGQSTSKDLMNGGNATGIYNSSEIGDGGENDFERLVLGKPSTAEGSSFKTAFQPAEPLGFSWSTPLSPSPNPSSRAITPDQSLNAFAPLQPTPRNVPSISQRPSSSLNTLMPVHPPFPSTSAWSMNSTDTLRPSPQTQPPPQPSFFIPPPPAANGSLSTFSLAPPPMQPQRTSTQPIYGAGLGGTGQVASKSSLSATANQPQRQKSGLDAYESLL